MVVLVWESVLSLMDSEKRCSVARTIVYEFRERYTMPRMQAILAFIHKRKNEHILHRGMLVTIFAAKLNRVYPILT